MNLPNGTRLGPYEVVAPIEAGGMGSVYRGRDTRLMRDVAVKVLPPGRMQDERAVERFLREARAAAALSHPNIVGIHDVGDAVVTLPGPFGGKETRLLYLVEEYVDGGSLRKVLRGSWRPDPATVVRWGLGILHALAAAHGKGLVHRDLKPENVLVDAQGNPKIADFGLVRWIYPLSAAPSPPDDGVRTDTLTNTGFVVGTLGYMSPEQVRGTPVDARSDLFGFGVLLFELLAGSSPFARTSTDDAFEAVLHHVPSPLTALVPGIPERLARVVSWCLEKEPDRRPESALALVPHLEQVQRELAAGPRASSPGLPQLPEANPASRAPHPLVFLGAAVAVLVAFGAGFAAGRARPEPRPGPASAVHEAADAGGTEPALSPDEAFLAFVRRDGPSSELWVARRDGSSPRRLARAESAAWAWPAFSADGASLLFYDVTRAGPNAGAGFLFFVRLAEGTPLPFGPDVRLDPTGRPAVAEDGSVLVRTFRDRSALLLEREGRAAVPLPFGAGLSLLAASPGGETIAARPGGGPLVLWRRAGGPT